MTATRNPIARALADARNRRRIVPDKRREEQQAVESREAEMAIKTHGEQIAQCVDDMTYGMIGIAIGSEDLREERRETYRVAKERLAVLMDARREPAKSKSDGVTNE